MTLARNVLVALTGISLAMTPALAAPVDRGSQTVEEGSELGSTGLFFVLAAIAVAILAVVAFNNDGDDPVSP